MSTVPGSTKPTQAKPPVGSSAPAAGRVPANTGASARWPERPPTPLQRQLDGAAPAKPTPLDAFRLARHTVLNSQRLDMRALALELGVNRVTLYRWVGTREQLLVEVLWSMTQWRFDQISAQVADRPGSRVPEILRRWVEVTVESPGIRHLLYDQNDLAMRLLTLESGGFQPRLLGLIRTLIETDIAEGRVVSPLDLEDLAFAVLRICESYIYLPVILDHEPNPAAMMRVIEVLLPSARPAAPAVESDHRSRRTSAPGVNPEGSQHDRQASGA